MNAPERADEATGVYVHVPWCRVRCPYCAFEIEARADRPPEQAWVEGVLRDRERWASHFPHPPRTLYFGGGTPSRVSAGALGSLVRAFGVDDVTAEANPEDLGEGWLEAVIDAGVTRVSLGVQTLVPRLARAVGRAHHDPRPALARVAASGARSWSADLMFGLPGQTLAELDADLDALIGAGAPHISLYGLTVEPGTGLERLEARRAQRGAGSSLPDEDLWRGMYDRIVERLEAEGILRYEVSNFARPGHESAHNRLYWTGQPYLGLGPSAHGLAPDGRRWVNPPLPRWWTNPEPAIELPDPRQRATDLLVSGLRGVEGVPLARLGSWRPSARVVDQLVRAGLLRDPSADGRLALGPAGWPVADAVVRALARALEEVERPTG